jgi:hypothetical protein
VTATARGPIAPALLVIELRGSHRRVFRQSRGLTDVFLELDTPAPFEPDEPVEARFSLPGDPHRVQVHGPMQVLGEADEEEGNLGCKGLLLNGMSTEDRSRIAAYVRQRLNPDSPS